jgi:hypothetical protein
MTPAALPAEAENHASAEETPKQEDTTAPANGEKYDGAEHSDEEEENGTGPGGPYNLPASH